MSDEARAIEAPSEDVINAAMGAQPAINGNPGSQSRNAGDQAVAQPEAPDLALVPADTDAPAEGIGKDVDPATASPEQLREMLAHRNSLLGKQANQLKELENKVVVEPEQAPNAAPITLQQQSRQFYDAVMHDPNVDPEVDQRPEDRGDFVSFTHDSLERFAFNIIQAVGGALDARVSPLEQAGVDAAEIASLAKIGVSAEQRDQLMAARPYIATMSGEAREQALMDAKMAIIGSGGGSDAGVVETPRQPGMLNPSMHVERPVAFGSSASGDYVTRAAMAQKSGGMAARGQEIANMMEAMNPMNASS